MGGAAILMPTAALDASLAVRLQQPQPTPRLRERMDAAGKISKMLSAMRMAHMVDAVHNLGMLAT